eukprot:scaffold6125_cov262-Ochromonas_danica.AAC.17
MDIEQQQRPSECDKDGLIEGEYETIEYLSDLWLGTTEKKNMPFLRLFRLASVFVIVIQYMVLASVIYENINDPPYHNLNFQIVATRLFVVIYLAGNVAEYFSKDVLGYYAMSRIVYPKLEELLGGGENEATYCAQIAYFLFVIIQGFYYAFGFPALIFGLIRMIKDRFNLRDIFVFIALSTYEYVLLVLALIASVSVILIQSDAVSILFNFSGVLVVMELDNVVFKLFHIKVKKMKELRHSEFQLTSAKLSLGGLVAVVTFLYSFVFRT